MGMQTWSNDILLVDLPQEERPMGDELKTVIAEVRDRGDIDVLIDFSNVDVFNSSNISELLKLHKLLKDCGHRLVFCNVAAATKGLFAVTGLEGIFDMSDDKSLALADLEKVGSD